MKFGVVPDFTTLPKPKHIAHAAISALKYFSSVPPVSHEVLNVWVANSWPLPYSAASFSVLSFGVASWALISGVPALSWPKIGVIKNHASERSRGKDQLSRLLEPVESGETVVIARDGKPVAELVRLKKNTGFPFDIARDHPLAPLGDEWWQPMNE